MRPAPTAATTAAPRAATEATRTTGSRDRAPGAAPRLRALDALRLLAALTVVLMHFTTRDHGRWGVDVLPHELFPGLSEVLRYGYVGMHLFFVLSGFVILMSAWGRSTGSFVASRISRLYPAFWVAVLLTATLRWLWPTFEARSVPEVLANLTMFHEPFDVVHVDGVYWTLWVEMQFYLLMAVLVALGLTRRRVLVTATALPLVGTALTLTMPGATETVTALSWVSMFGAGMVMYLIYRDGHSVKLWALVALNTAQGVLVAALTQTDSIEAISSGAEVSPLVLALAVLGVVAAVAVIAFVPAIRDLDWRWLTAVGTLTFPLYLTHEYVGWALIEALHPVLGKWGTLAVAVGVCLGLAWLIHRFVEKRWHRRMRRWLEARLSPPRATPDLPASDPPVARTSGSVGQSQ
ncbi:acyltransferase [Occultella glacieicola]|uniref:Acyltransferase n=1 Tax=Occultella glacieicola TaxID=2518684 RepID=A0ABY2E3H3_9MICO|nr:acyltransferase [Occultella glacieicola]TDE94182.1 acyltransferase [Occultella glacieicola]